MICTFYSYKGGVGRTMALANIAELFFQAGFKVLMVDWDLEAPGLERFFPSLDLQDTLNKPGVIDMLLRYKEQMTLDLDENTPLELESPSKYIIDVYPQETDSPRLLLLPAGRRSDSYLADYAQAVLTFDWQDFYESWEGERYFDWLREQFESIADITLIDSRTGITEMGGVCTYQLADLVVMLCAANEQSLKGTYEMAVNLTSAPVQNLRHGEPLRLLIIPARIERAESELLDRFQQAFMDLFRDLVPQEEVSIRQLWELGIPYVPKYAFSEAVAVREGARASAKDMALAFRGLLQVISQLMLIRLPPRDILMEKKNDSCRILLVEADTNWQNLVTASLEGQGYDLRIVDNPDRAKHMLKEQEFDLVITEVNFTDYRDQMGFGLLSFLQKEYPSLPRIVMTANIGGPILSKYAPYSVNEVLFKESLSLSQVLRSIEEAVGQRNVPKQVYTRNLLCELLDTRTTEHELRQLQWLLKGRFPHEPVFSSYDNLRGNTKFDKLSALIETLESYGMVSIIPSLVIEIRPRDAALEEALQGIVF